MEKVSSSETGSSAQRRSINLAFPSHRSWLLLSVGGRKQPPKLHSQPGKQNGACPPSWAPFHTQGEQLWKVNVNIYILFVFKVTVCICRTYFSRVRKETLLSAVRSPPPLCAEGETSLSRRRPRLNAREALYSVNSRTPWLKCYFHYLIF